MDKDGFKEVKVRLVLEEGTPLPNGVPIRTPEDVLNYLSQEMKDLNQEQVVVVNLDNTLKPINFNVLSQGGLASCQVPMEQVYTSTILSSGSSILLLHNHPSGSLKPSQFDLDVTERLAKAGQIIGIPLVDHVIVAGQTGEYRSIRVERPELFADSPLVSEVADPGKMQELMEKLQDGVKGVFNSVKYKEHLKVMSKFHHYSVNNQLLIGMQMPEATLVAGYDAWKRNFGRQVIKGSKAINIIAPMIIKDKKEVPAVDANGNTVLTEQEVLTTRFKPAPVFDISQTYGPPLPTIAPEELVGKVALYDDMMSIMQEISPVPIRFAEIAGDAKGYYSYVDKEIVIQKGMSEAQIIKTAVHEISHAKLHDRDEMEKSGERKDLQTKEVEAESTAFVVCSSMGLPTDDYSFPYIAGWSEGKEMKVLQDSLATIRSTADGMISEIEERLNKIDRYEIYQISEDGKLAESRFRDFEELEGKSVNVADYDRVYIARYDGTETLDDIFTRININHPDDFSGHSLSVSDVIVLHQGGKDKSYYVDSFGFCEIENFKGKEQKNYDRNIEKSYEKQKIR